MDSLQLAHNSHLSQNLSFAESDPNLRKMDSQKVKYQPELLNQLPQSEPGIYLLTGGRQVGKTTSLKLWMKLLLNKGWSPNNIIFLTGEIISNHYQLIEIINQIVENYFKNSQLSVLIIDEITYIENWDKGIKFLADLGVFNKIILILTGSDQKILKDAPMTFPGRRGQALKDFRLWPLSFKETLLAKKIIASDESKEIENLTDEILEKAFSEYLMHGGYLVAINDWAKSGKIEEQTYKIYSDWITGDFLKRAKSEQFLKEILAALIKRYGSAISWNNLAKDLSIDHPATVASYIELLVSLEALYVLPALIEDKLQPAPKKGKKIFFLDPFIYHSVKYLNQPNGTLAVKDSEELSLIIEGIASAHYYRNYPCYYIKADKEVDLAYIKNDKFYPVEIKWTNQVRPEDLKQILKYQNGLILSKNHGESKIDNTPVRFLPRELLKL